MRTARRRSVGLLSMTVLLVAGVVVGSIPSGAQTSVTQQVPFTVWDAQTQTSLDGVGSWVATGNDPTAGAGQAPAGYAYFHEFYFQGSDAFGHLAMETDGGEKSVSFTVFEPTEDRVHIVNKGFDWQANRFYFPVVRRVADGLWGAWIFDHTANTWTFVGGVVLPATLVKLDPETATGAAWTGADLDSCAAYPKADVFRMAAVGLVGSGTVTAAQSEQIVHPGDCPASVTSEPPGWNRYQLGADPSAAGVAAQTDPTPSDHPPVEERRFRS